MEHRRGAGAARACSAGCAGGGGGIDLDLACLWEFTDGSKGVVQALGNAFQAPYRGAPIIRLDGDDRSGSGTGGENMFIDLSRVDEIRRILVFAFIYEGVPNWAERRRRRHAVPGVRARRSRSASTSPTPARRRA